MSQEVPEREGQGRLICQADLMARHWTKTMIRDLLPIPEARRPNPRYQNASPMKLYALERVAEIEATDAFKQMSAKAARRRVAAKKSAASQREQLLKKIETITVQLPILSSDDLIGRACHSYRSLHDGRSPGSDQAFIDRICVNYLRHECSTYEQELAKIFGKTGVADAKSLIRTKVYDAIAEAYPKLSRECDRQWQERESQELYRWPSGAGGQRPMAGEAP